MWSAVLLCVLPLAAAEARPLSQASPPLAARVSGDTVVLRPDVPAGALLSWTLVPCGDRWMLVLAVHDASGLHQCVFVVSPAAGPGPEPGPGPGPGPAPEPLPPLAKRSLDLAMALPPAERAMAVPLAASIEGVAARISAGTVKTVEEAMAAMRESNRSTLGSHAEAWRPWAEGIKRELDALYDAGKLKTLEEHATAFRQIAQGLRQVK